MKIRMRTATALVFLLTLAAAAQQADTTAAVWTAPMVPPPLIQFSGLAADEGGAPFTGTLRMTFALYSARQGGEPLWTEAQDVQVDGTGHYSVQLGITKPGGVPAALFTAGEARWLGVQIAGQEEQARVLLVSVPYALKAGDAATLGGLPPSAFLMAASGNANAIAAATASPDAATPAANPAVTGTGAADYLPLWDSTSDIISSVLYQSGSGATAKIGIGTTTPASALDVKGGATIRGTTSVLGTLALPATGAATSTGGKNSEPLTATASAYNSTSAAAVAQAFQLQAEPAGNDSATPSGTLNVLFGSGTTKPAETGLKIASNGQITFAEGQKFPSTGTITGVTTAAGSGLTGGGTTGTLSLTLTKSCATNQLLQWNGSAWECASAGAGTVTSVASGAGLTGGPITGSGTLSIATGGVSNAMLANQSLTITPGTGLTGGGAVALGGTTTLNVDTTKVPLLAGANTFTGNQTVNGNLSASGVVTGSSFQIGSNLFAYGSYTNFNAFLGFAGNGTSTAGLYNTAVGFGALHSNTSPGNENTAIGNLALYANTTGYNNTASGDGALYTNTTGNQNTASGVDALEYNTTGGFNTASGVQALYGNTTGGNNTAGGFQALYHNATGSNNTGIGYYAGPDSSSTNLSYATAIGANAVVSASNAMALGAPGAVSSTTGQVNVGIGTATPGYRLDINYGDMIVRGLQNFPLSGQAANLYVGDTNHVIQAVNAQGIYIRSASANGLLVADGGNVGVGTTSPANQFEVQALSTTVSAVRGIGANGPTGSGQNGGTGLSGLGGSGDPDAPSTSGAYGGPGVVGLGGDGSCSGCIGGAFDGPGGAFTGGDATFGDGDGVDAYEGSGYAGSFIGDIQVTGAIYAGTKDFKIDHPLDPANKYLYHASVESSEMMNIYTGNVTTDAQGEATVQLPEWFEVLNGDFRYQLTVIGVFAQAIVSREIQNHQFQIRTNLPNVKVSWQITGVRQDAYAKAHPLVVEKEKEPRLHGYYIHPELYGAPEEKQIEWARHPALMKWMKEQRDAQRERAPRTRPWSSTEGPVDRPAPPPELAAPHVVQSTPPAPVAPRLIPPVSRPVVARPGMTAAPAPKIEQNQPASQ